MNKFCLHCSQEKSISEFSIRRRSYDGVQVYCKSCMGEYGKRERKLFDEVHKERERTRDRERYAANREQKVARASIYNAAHRKEKKEYNKEYSIRHPDRQRLFYATHPGKITEYKQRRRARKINAGGNGITVKQWHNMKEEYNRLCAYCNQEKPLAMDHVVPLAKGGRHDVDNIVPACRSCNASKGNKPLLIWMVQQKAVI